MIRIAAIAAVVVAGLGLLSMFFLTGRDSGDQFASCGAGAVAGDLGGPFTLVNGDGVTMTSAELITEPTLIYFGYTYCPDVCPLDVDRNAAAIEILNEPNERDEILIYSADKNWKPNKGDIKEEIKIDLLTLSGGGKGEYQKFEASLEDFFEASSFDEFKSTNGNTLRWYAEAKHGEVELLVDGSLKYTSPDKITTVTPVFISVDPARDTPEVVRDFADAMHPRMIGLTGSEEQVAVASKAYRTYYKAHPPVDGEYLVDHSTFSYLVTPENGFLEFFRRELTPEQMADKIGCFIDQI